MAGDPLKKRWPQKANVGQLLTFAEMQRQHDAPCFHPSLEHAVELDGAHHNEVAFRVFTRCRACSVVWEAAHVYTSFEEVIEPEGIAVLRNEARREVVEKYGDWLAAAYNTLRRLVALNRRWRKSTAKAWLDADDLLAALAVSARLGSAEADDIVLASHTRRGSSSL